MIIATVLLSTLATVAQTKVGTINPELIISKMPELAGVQDAVKVYSEDLSKELQGKIDDYEAKVKEYQEGEAGFPDATKKLNYQIRTGYSTIPRQR